MVTVGLPTARTQREDTAQPYGRDGNYTTTHKQNHQHTTTTFLAFFRRSFDLKLSGSTAVFVHAANLGNLSRKVCCFNNYKVRIVRTLEYPPFRSTSNPTLSD